MLEGMKVQPNHDNETQGSNSMQFGESAFVEEASSEGDHGTQPSPYGLADVLFPVTPPSPKEARLVLGRAGLRCSVTEQWHSQGKSVFVHTHFADQSAPTAVAKYKSAYKSRRRGDRAARNRSLLAAAGLDKDLECIPASAGF